MPLAECERPGEEQFGRHGEVFGRIGRAVAADEAVAAAAPEPPVIGAEGLDPCRLVVAGRERRHAIGGSVELVEFVSELVVDDVHAPIRVGDLPGRSLPVEQHRAAAVTGLTREELRAGADDPACRSRPVTACDDRPSVDDHRADVEVWVGGRLESGHEQGGVGGDRMDHRLGDDHVAALPPTACS